MKVVLSDQSITLLKTSAFKQLLIEISAYTANLEKAAIDAATNGDPYDEVRFRAGRYSGASYLLGVLKHVEKKADATETQPTKTSGST